MLVGYCVAMLLIMIYGYTCWRDNKKKEVEQAAWEQEHGRRDEEVVGDEWKDLTDKQNPFFRYTW